MLTVPIIGNPVSQVKAPDLLNPMFEARGIPARMVPTSLPVDDFDVKFASLLAQQDVAGVVITLPFKAQAAFHCVTLDRSGELAGAVNLLVRGNAGWHGLMVDGQGFVHALKKAGFSAEGKRAFMLGAGGAGSGIAVALVEAGLKSLSIRELQPSRVDRLAARLEADVAAVEMPTDLSQFDLVVNATSLGLREDDPLPFDLSSADRSCFVGDVIAEPSISRLRRAADALGLSSIGGMDMLQGQVDLIFRELKASISRTMQGASA